MSLRLIDPNKINNGFSVQPEDLCIDLQLTAYQKGKSIIIGDGKALTTKQQHESEVDILNGQLLGDKKFLTTMYTEIGSGFDTMTDDNKFKDLETLGITSVDVEFNASNVPVVKMTLLDVRGRLFQQGNDSPFSIFFQFPYPIFKFRAKGYFGKSISYDLHLVKFNTQFNSDSGGFDINCDFVGYTYAYLSDLLIGYTRAVPYTTIGQELSSTMSTSFSDYQNNAYKLAEIAREFKTSQTSSLIDQQNKGSENLIQLKDSFIQSVKETFQKNRPIEHSQDGLFLIGHSMNQDIESDKKLIENIDSLFRTKLSNDDFGGMKITYEVSSNTSLSNENGYIHNETSLSALLTTFNQKHKSANNTLTFIDASKLFSNIDNTKTQLNNSANQNTEDIISGMSSAITNSGLSPTIGEYFKMLTSHADLLWASIQKVGENIMNDSERNTQFSDLSIFSESNDTNTNNEKILPFPDFKKLENGTYVDDWIGNGAAGGKSIPEAIFVEELIQGFLKAFKELKALEDKLNSFENEASTNTDIGITEYIPIHPMDGPSGGGSLSNPYFDIVDYDGFISRLCKRFCSFLSLQRYGISDPVIKSLCEVEAINIREGLKENATLANLIQQKGGTSAGAIEFLDVSLADDMKSEFLSDISKEMKKHFLPIDGFKEKAIFEYLPSSAKNKDERRQLSYADFGPERPLVPFYTHGYRDGVYTTNGAGVSNGKLIEITTSDSIDEFGISSKFDIELDTTNTYDATNAIQNFSEKFGVPYVDNYAIQDSYEMFINDKAIGLHPLVKDSTNTRLNPSFFSPKGLSDFIVNKNKVTNIKYDPKESFRFMNDTNLINYRKVIKVKSFSKGLKDDSVYLSDLPVLIDGSYGSLFLSPFFYNQSDEIKALMFLHSIPFKLPEDTTYKNYYFSDSIMMLLKGRTKILKGSYAWCALMGGLMKLNNTTNDPKYRIYVRKNNRALVGLRKTNLNYVIEANSIYLKQGFGFITENTYKETNKYGVGLVVNNDDEFIKLPPMTKLSNNFPKQAYDEFTGVFDEFLVYFKAEILPNLNLITSKTIGYKDLNEFHIDTVAAGLNQSIINQYSALGFNEYYSNGDGFEVLNHNNFAKMKEGSKISNEIQTLLQKTAYISLGSSNIFDPYLLDRISKPINTLGYNYLYKTFASLGALLNETITNSLTAEANALNELKEMIGLNDSEDIRIKVYKDLKSIYEKWVNGDSELKDLYSKFKFQNRHYKDISDEFRINPINMIRDLMNNLHQPLIAHISKVLSENNFNFLPTPSYIDIHNTQEMNELFKPFRWNETIDAVESMFVCMYVGEFSSKLDFGSKTGNYRSDGIKLTIDDSATVPEITNINVADFTTDKDIPIIRVKFGDNSQSIFKRFGLDQSEFTITNESLVVTDDLTKNNGLSQNLYDIYLSRSYTLNLEMMGNFMIQPFMYLYLENIPMFYGLYYIVKVSHKVAANNVITTVKAVRMRQTMTKMLDEESLYYSLFSIFKDAQYSTSDTSKSGRRMIKTGTVKTSKGLTAEVNLAYVGKFQAFIDDLEKIYDIRVIGGYSYRPNVNSPDKLSFHSWGATLDINPKENPNGTRKTDMPIEQVQALIKKHGLGWGYNWKSVGDPMHFSVARGEGGSENIKSDGTNVPNRLSEEVSGEMTIGETSKVKGKLGVGVLSFKPIPRTVENGKKGCGKITTSGLDKYTKAFLDMIAFAEGTISQSNNGYDYLINERVIANWKPDTDIAHGGWKSMTTAAGRYQFLRGTWSEHDGNIPMTTNNQDTQAARKLKQRLKSSKASLSSMVDKNEFFRVMKGGKGKTPLENEWESFYKATYTSKTPNMNLNNYYDMYIYALSKY